MELTPEQQNALRSWLQEGLSLSEIQKRLENEFSLRMTYMDLRFLVDDLDFEVKDDPQKLAEREKVIQADEAAAQKTQPGGAGEGKVSVSLDRVTRPGSVISGQAVFSDGESAEWYLDQMGRLGLNPTTTGYRPSEEDLQEFQQELQKAMQQKGF